MAVFYFIEKDLTEICGFIATSSKNPSLVMGPWIVHFNRRYEGADKPRDKVLDLFKKKNIL